MSARTKQDGALPRTPEDLERKYEFEKRFRELKKAEQNAKNAASKEYVDRELEGKVSKGFGLGEIPRTSEDINKEMTTGYFRTMLATANTSITHGAAHVRVYDNKEAVQNLIRVTTGVEQVRRTTDGGVTWSEKYVNPPMNVGTEYATTEYYNGKTVYKKLVDFGALPSSATKSVAHGIPSLFAEAMPVSIEVFTSSGSVFQQFPFINNAGSVVGKVHLTATSIVIITVSDVSAYTNTKVLIKYVKN